MSQFCSPGRPGPSSKQIASMRKVIAEDYYRCPVTNLHHCIHCSRRSQSNAPNLQRSSSVVEHRQSSTYPEPAGVYTKATDRCFLPPVCKSSLHTMVEWLRRRWIHHIENYSSQEHRGRASSVGQVPVYSSLVGYSLPEWAKQGVMGRWLAEKRRQLISVR